ncbi:hypothetical protein GCM10011419_25140 [Vogesella fluminis]|uniref:Uncharacterized protein n=1 Tax=Vogesella fluminis TaxID=1069161 RepID=A0ABQ3HBF6_9NEIS|nr:hypothetical protein GCM10011419_25140 [Vogesella fluminis]
MVGACLDRQQAADGAHVKRIAAQPEAGFGGVGDHATLLQVAARGMLLPVTGQAGKRAVHVMAGRKVMTGQTARGSAGSVQSFR